MVASDGGQPEGTNGPSVGPEGHEDGQTDFVHEPVMLAEVVDLAKPLPPGVFLDATVGGAGHAAGVLEVNPGLRLLGLDQDPTALQASSQRLDIFGDRVQLVRCRFDQTGRVLQDIGTEVLVGFLFDLGVSSPQLDRGERGFSFRNDGPLDMRMDPDAKLSAEEIVNRYDERELAGLLRRNADERNANRIAAAIVASRPVRSTSHLAEIVADATPAPARRRPGHPARRTFQAIRIGVNDELEVLKPALDSALDALGPNGRGIVITYHSGEDRIVKDIYRRRSESGIPAGLPVKDASADFAVLRPPARKASAEEQARNPRATSARLRAIERTAA